MAVYAKAIERCGETAPNSFPHSGALCLSMDERKMCEARTDGELWRLSLAQSHSSRPIRTP